MPDNQEFTAPTPVPEIWEFINLEGGKSTPITGIPEKSVMNQESKELEFVIKTIDEAEALILSQDKTIKALQKQLTATQQALDSAVEALQAGKDAIEIFILEKAAQEDPDSMAELFELIKTTGKKIHELIAERYNKIEAALATINKE